MGLVQGLTEFLPVSSSGHLVLFQRILGISGDMLLFDIVLHLGTLLAVVIVFRKDLWECIKHPLSKETLFLIVATIPAILLALFFGDWIEKTFSGAYLGFGFLITAVLLFITGRRKHPVPVTPDLTYKHALIIGLFQGVALLPGISRSGATVSGGLICGMPREKAARFSFLLSVPIILASAVYKIAGVPAVTESLEILPALIGLLAAAASGFLAIKLMLDLIKKSKLWYFAVYLTVLGTFVLLNQYVLMWF